MVMSVSARAVSPSPPAPRARTVVVDDYAQLKRLVASRGLLERRASRYLGHALGVSVLFAALVTAIALTRDSWWALIWAAPAALLFGQLGFLAHDACHNQVLDSSRRNYALSLFLFNVCLGGSRGWWADKHNIHHAQPNRLGVDPDIEGGVIAVTAEQTAGVRGVARFVMRRQERAIWPLLSLGILQIHAYSVRFLFHRSLRNARVEAALLVTHNVAYLGGVILLLGVGEGCSSRSPISCCSACTSVARSCPITPEWPRCSPTNRWTSSGVRFSPLATSVPVASATSSSDRSAARSSTISSRRCRG